jgi:hypothetical protein
MISSAGITAEGITAQGKLITPWLKTAKHGYMIFRPRGMKGFVWDYVVDEKLDVDPSTHKFKPKLDLPRGLTSGVFYDLRKPLEGAGYDVTSKEAAKRRTRETIQVDYIKSICDSLEIRRVDIGILAGEAGHLFYRGEHYAISLDELDSLKRLGVIILIIEKRGIAELLRDVMAPYGIAILSTQGFLTENALDLADLASKVGGKIAILTDYDISGIMIAYQVPEVPRIGIDGETTLGELDILNKKRDVEETYIPGKTHLKAVEDNIDDFEEPVDLDYLKNNRIEIDAVLKEVGAERFCNWIMMKLEEIFGSEELNYLRSIVVPQPNEFVPDDLRRLNTIVIDRIRVVLQPEINSTSDELAHYTPNLEGGLIENVEDYEDDLHEQFQDVVDENADTGPIVKDIKKLIKKYDGKVKSPPLM